MTRLTLKLFGRFEARDGRGQAIAFPRRKAEALLAYLALQPGQPQPRERLAELLWGGEADERRRHSLRQVLVSLRQCLSTVRAPVLVESGETIGVNPATLDVDVLNFERLVAAGTPEALARAADLHDGELLAGLGAEDTAFDAWLLARRERLREKAIQSLLRLLELQQSRGDEDAAIATAVRLLALDRTQEAVHRTLMLLYARRGRRSAALRQYQICLAALEQELGAAPEAETRRLYRELLRAGAAAEPQARPAAFARQGQDPSSRTGVPLIGRGAELARLRELQDGAARGEGASVVIRGDAGIGKSRLVEALVEEAERAGALVLLGRAWEPERNLPFGPWINAFRAAGVTTGLADLDAATRREFARLLPEAGVPPADSPAADPLRLFAAVARVLERLAQQGPVVVVIEDLHWADDMTPRLLEYLAQPAAAWPVLLLTTVRPAEVPASTYAERALAELSRQPRAQQIALGPLSRADTLAVVAALVRAGTGARTLRSLGSKAYRLSKGNPFLVGETIRAARDAGAVDAYQAPPQDALVSGRLERLGSLAAQVAAVAAVIGREFELALLARAASLDAAEAAEGVAELVERGLLQMAGERLDFAHDRIRDAALARLPEPHRRMLHAAVARALEELHAGNAGDHRLALGRHCFEAGRWERAFRYLSVAGLDAAARSAHREAVASFEQALAAAAHLHQTPEVVRSIVDLGFALRGSLTLLGDLKGTLECLRAAEPQARSLGDPALQAWVSILAGSCLALMGQHEEALAAGERARTIVAAQEIPEVAFYWPAISLAQARFFMGDFGEVQALLRPAASASERDAGHRKHGVIGHPAVVSHTFLALSLAETGEFDDALAHALRALALAERLDSPWDMGHACMAAGVVHLRHGQAARAIPNLQRGVELTRARDLPMGARILTPVLGCALARGGQAAAALALLAPVVAAPLLPYCLNFVGEAYLLAGRPEEAAGVVSRALEHGTRRKEHGVRAWAYWLQGRIAAGRAQPDGAAARGHYRKGLALAEERGMLPLVAHCRSDIAELNRTRGGS